MIATRISKNEDALKDYGVSIYNASGELRSTYDILVDLAPAWDKMSKAEQVALGNTLAGTNQYKILAAVMSQMDVAQEAYAQALDSSGETMKQNAVYMESLEAKTTALKAEFEKIVLGNGGLQDFAKELVELGTGALKLINWLGGLKPALITLTSLLIGLNTIKIGTWFANLGKSIKNISSVISDSIGAWKSYILSLRLAETTEAELGTATATLGTTMQASIPIIGLVAAAIGLITAGIVAHNQKLEEQKRQIQENIKSFSDEYKALDDVSERLKDENISREELNSIIDSNLDEYEAERLKLLGVNEAREKTIELIEKEKKAKAQELVDTGLSEYEESLKNIEEGFDEFDKFFYNRKESYSKGILEKAGISDAKTAKEQIASLKKLKEALVDARSEALDKNNSKDTFGTKNLEKEISKVEGLITELNKKYDEHIGIVSAFRKALDILGLHYDETSKTIEEGAKRSYIAEEERRKGLEASAKATKKTRQELDELRKKYNITSNAIYDYIEAHEEENLSYDQAIENLALEAEAQQQEVNSLDELNKKYKQSFSTSKDLISNISKLSSALKEQSENGSLAVSTQLDLIESGYGAALMYDKETGACKLDEKAVIALTESKLEMQIANLNIERSKVVDQLIREANQAVTTAGAFLELAKAKNIANQASLENSIGRGYSASYEGYGNNGGWLSDELKESRALLDSYNDEIEALERNLKNIKTNGTSAFASASKGAGKAKDATKELNKELEETKKKYETVIKWISKQYDKEIDKIKKSEKEALKAEESKIKAKEKEKDNALDAIEKEIKALEKEKEALKDQKEALDERKQALKDEQDAILDNIEKRIKVLEKERDALIKPVEARIKALEEERDAITEATQAEIDSINELKEKRQTYWDDQIDALKNANKELKDNLELQEKLDALEKAKNTKVKIYKEGQGFVYDVDQNAVNEAQKALDEYLSQKAYEDELARLENLKDAEIKSYNDRLKELNNYKDNTKKTYDKQLNDLKNYKDKTKSNYDEQIENLKEYKESVQEQYEEQIKVLEKDIDALEKHMDELDKHKDAIEEHKDAVEEAYEAEIEDLNNHKEAVQEAYEAEIEEWEHYKEEWEKLVNDYEEKQNRLLFEQLTGITDESNNWMTRLDNLAEFVKKYNELQAQLDTGNTDVSNTARMSSGFAPSGGYSGDGGSTRTVTNYNKPSSSTNYTPSYNKKTGYVPTSVSSKIGGRSGAVKRYANGIDSIRDDEIAIVGENPNREVVIGSKINNGDIMSLGKGTGVVNAESTKTLAGMLNQVGQFGASGFGSGNGVLNNNINNDSLVVNGVTIEGSNISDPETFVNGLLNMKAEAIQRAYRHR